MTQKQLSAPLTGGNENTGLLKVIAILCMIADHIGAKFFPTIVELRVIGRIAFPLFAWCLCVGAVHTRNVWKYALRVLLVGILSQPFYMQALDHKWYQLNVFATLLLGLLAIAGIRKKRWGSHIWAPALALACSVVIQMDYGWQGVLFILLLYACRGKPSTIAALMISYCLYWGYGTFQVNSFLGVNLAEVLTRLTGNSRLGSDMARVQFYAILALPLMLIPMKGRLRLPKWISYGAYPAHLLVLGVIRHWNNIMFLFHR